LGVSELFSEGMTSTELPELLAGIVAALFKPKPVGMTKGLVSVFGADTGVL
jgi:hypothetical protein